MRSIVAKESYVTARRTVLVIFFTLLMILASYARIHLFFTPVPITFQTFVLFLSLAFLRDKSYMPQAFYLAMGISGFSVFGNGGSGLVYMLGPTGGYLVGFLAAALIAGVIMRRVNGVIKSYLLGYVTLFSFANVIVYIFGVIWLVAVYGVSFRYALTIGVIPFIAGDAAKIILAAYVSYKLRRLL